MGLQVYRRRVIRAAKLAAYALRPLTFPCEIDNLRLNEDDPRPYFDSPG